MRAAEARAIAGGVSADELFERAGLAVAHEVRRLAGGRPVLIAAGAGGNGGDAYVAAQHLADWGLDVAVAAFGAPGDGPARRAAARWHGPVASPGEAAARPILVDGLFGIGASRGLSDDHAGWFAARRAVAERVIAIDLPSGIDADAVADRRSVKADVTVALGALKPAHVVGAAAARCGHVVLADLGIAPASDVRTIAPPVLRAPAADAHKFTRGMVAVIGGAMPGAAMLAATAAMRGGAGYVVLGEEGSGRGTPHALVRRDVPTAGLADFLGDTRIGACLVGPGLGRDRAAADRLAATLAAACDVVVDADALSLLATGDRSMLRADGRRVYLTPHDGEFDRLFGTGGGNRIEQTLAAARDTGAVVVHKGPDTVIASPDGRVTIAAGATPWLSTAGSGDVLAGLLASRHACSHGDDPHRIAGEAVWLHAAAATLAGPAFVADDLAQCLPAALEFALAA